MKKILIILALSLVLISFISAQDIRYYVEYNRGANLTEKCTINGMICDSSYECNLTVVDPDLQILVNNDGMTRTNGVYVYELLDNQTINLGKYEDNVYCYNGVYNGTNTFYHKVTGNGNEDPDGIVVVLFVGAFIILMFYLIFFVLYGIGHFIALDFDMKDLAFNMGGYFALLGLYMLGRFYVGNLDINGFLEIFIYIGAITNVFLPITAFMVCFFKQNMKVGDRNA